MYIEILEDTSTGVTQSCAATGEFRAGYSMNPIKDTLRATVHIGFDGRVMKKFRGPKAEERFQNEVLVLRYLNQRSCPFVPRLLEVDEPHLRIVTTSCGSRVQHLDPIRQQELFLELETYGVRHDDPDIRNITYRQQDGRFCLIDFEFATILEKQAIDDSVKTPL